MDYEEVGKKWLKGEVSISEFNGILFNEKQSSHLNGRKRFELISGGMASGKTISWVVKFILLHMFFPGVPSLIGRKTKQNAVTTFMEAFQEVCPPNLYVYKAGDAQIIFSNGSTATFFGLDALQSGNGEDTKKAQQFLKSHTFGLVFIDQLEEIEEKVFEALNSRLRWRPCKHSKDVQKLYFENGGTIMAPDYTKKIERLEDSVAFHQKHGYPQFQECQECGKMAFNQMNFTTNPANFWGYSYFKSNPRPMTHLVETSMLDNRANLSEAFVQSELQKPKRYVQKYVYGEWSPDSLIEGGVFSEEYIKAQEFNIKEPVRTLDGVKIFAEPEQHHYQIGIDPSEGATDPCHIKVMCIETGEEVANYMGFVPLSVIANKAVQLALMYATVKKPLIVCESQGGGQAVIEALKKSYDNIYEREVFNHREKKYTKKLGFHTNFASKQLLIDHTTNLFQRNFLKIRDKATVEELKTFIYSNESTKKGAGAQSGYHDDAVMALMLACWNVEAVTQREKTLLDRVTRQNKKSTVKYQYN
jgi:hypothetical protein